MSDFEPENLIMLIIAIAVLLATSTCSYWVITDANTTKYCKISGQCTDSLKQQKFEIKNEKPLITIGKE